MIQPRLFSVNRFRGHGHVDERGTDLLLHSLDEEARLESARRVDGGGRNRVTVAGGIERHDELRLGTDRFHIFPLFIDGDQASSDPRRLVSAVVEEGVRSKPMAPTVLVAPGRANPDRERKQNR